MGSETTPEQTIVRFVWMLALFHGLCLHTAYAASVALGLAGYSVPMWLVAILLMCTVVISPKPKSKDGDKITISPLGRLTAAALARHCVVGVIVWPWIGLAWLVLP